MLNERASQFSANSQSNTETVFQAISSAARPISVEDISVRTLLPLDVVNRAVAMLLQADRITVFEQAPEPELELQLA
jgi:hypothetical protein